MEEMAAYPREEMGKRVPGEKNAMERIYERSATTLPATPRFAAVGLSGGAANAILIDSLG